MDPSTTKSRELEAWRFNGPVNGPSSTLGVPHERFVVLQKAGAVEQLPAVAAVVGEAGRVPAEVGALLQAAGGAHLVFQVWVNLHLLHKLQRFDLYESGRHRFHVGLGAVESDP